MSAVLRVAGLALLGLGMLNVAVADTPLQSGTPAALSLPGQTYITNYYIDVDSAAQQLRVSAAANGGDVDLFLRCGSPFPTQGAQAVGWELLDRYAQYHSVSSTSDESILVLRSSRVPVSCGRWYIAVINSDSTAASGSLTATTSSTLPAGTIALDFQHPYTDLSDHTNDCDDSFWSDPTPVAAIGGNTATTLGQQRKNALTYATQQLVQQLDMHAAITVHACGAHLGGDANSAILAHAAPNAYFFDEPYWPLSTLPRKYTWYPAAAIANLSGTSMCGFAGGPCDGLDQNGQPNNEEIEITFNEDIGKAGIIGGETFYLGFQSGPPSAIDFVTVAMHEMTHGLGFFGLANTDSAQGPIGAKVGIDTQANSIAYTNVDNGPYDDIFDVNVASVAGMTYRPFMGYEVNGTGDAARAAALLSGPVITLAGHYDPGIYTGLRWLDPAAVNSPVNIHNSESAPNDLPSLYAPCDESATPTCATQPSSTLSHTVQANDMMNAYYSRFNLRNMGLAVPMLGPVGWSNAPVSMPAFAQPIPSNWFDRTHSGHGFDFQLVLRDAARGDVYFLTFYTYAADGTPEWYQASGRLIDGVFVPDVQSDGETLYRLVYDSTGVGGIHFHADSACRGNAQTPPCSVVVDFNQAANSPACRNVDRSGAALLGVMRWSIGSESGNWCMEPLVPVAAHASPDANGHWFASNDGGWGFELLDLKTSGNPAVTVYVYYPGPNGQPVWATAGGTLTNNATGSMSLLAISNGYCRTCTPPGQLSGAAIGTMSLTFDSGYTSGTATITTSSGFSRTAIPISMLSVPTGH